MVLVSFQGFFLSLFYPQIPNLFLSRNFCHIFLCSVMVSKGWTFRGIFCHIKGKSNGDGRTLKFLLPFLLISGKFDGYEKDGLFCNVLLYFFEGSSKITSPCL